MEPAKPVPNPPPTGPTPAASPRPLRSKKRLWWAIGAAAGLIIIIVTVYAIVSWQRYHRLAARLSSTDSGNLAASYSLTGSSFLSALKGQFTANGSFQKTPVTATALRFQGDLGGQNYGGQGIVSGNALYFKLEAAYEPVLRFRQSVFTYQLTPAWTKTSISNNLYDNICDVPADTHFPDWLKLYQQARAIKLHRSLLYNPWARLDGKPATHYHGRVDTKGLIAWLNQLGQQGPKDCGLGTIGLSADDLAKVTVRYDLWTAADRDKLLLSVDNRDPELHMRLSVTGSDYGRGAVIELPSGAIDLDAIHAAQAGVLNRDAARRSDLDRLHDALSAYAAAHGNRYPAGLTSLIPQYLAVMPRDPSTHQPYQYRVSANGRDYDLRAVLETPRAGLYVLSDPI